MMRTVIRSLGILAVVCFFALAPGGAIAGEKFPASPIEAVVSWPAGGGTDIAARNALQFVEKDLGQKINVVNIPGGGGAIGYVQGAKKRADGYHWMTLQFDILSVQAQGLAPVSHADFDTIAMFADQPVVLLVKNDSPFKTLDDFVKAAKGRSLKIGGASVAGVWHQAAHLMAKTLGITYTYIPFSGIVEVLPAILGKHIDAGVCFLSGTSGSLKAGDVRIIAVMAKERLKAYPQVPTFKELGHNIQYVGFYGMAMPKGAPKDAISVVTAAFERASKNPTYQADANAKELNPAYLGPEQFRKFLNEMYPTVERLSKEIAAANK